MALTKIRANTQIQPGSISENLLDSNFVNRLVTIEGDITNINGDSTVVGSIDQKVDTAVNNLVDNAPGLMDTLNELAAALGDDPAFATTVTSELALKATKVELTSESDRAKGVEGTLASLTTTSQTNLVSAINEVNADAAANAAAISAESQRASSAETAINTAMGSVANLSTTANTVVTAINEVNSEADANATAIDTLNVSLGTIGGLTTTATNVVAAINEVNSEADANAVEIQAIKDDTSIIRESDIVKGESLGGAIDGTNVVFTLTNAARSGSIEVYVNGLINFAPSNFTVNSAGTQITFSAAPVAGDVIAVSYIKAPA